MPLEWEEKGSEASYIKRCQQLPFPKLLFGVREMKYHTNVQWALLLRAGGWKLRSFSAVDLYLGLITVRLHVKLSFLPFKSFYCSFHLVCFAVSDCVDNRNYLKWDVEGVEREGEGLIHLTNWILHCHHVGLCFWDRDSRWMV